MSSAAPTTESVQAQPQRLGRLERSSILGVDGNGGFAAAGRFPESERRPANLEDVFVLLTGEGIGLWPAATSPPASAGSSARRSPASSCGSS
jgi:hypothetical protein